MKIKSLLLIAAQITTCSIIHAQTKLVALKKGDQVRSDLSLGKIINHKTSTATISDFKGRLIILDFWATWCAPCIHSLQKLDSLQRLFGDKIAIIPVNGNQNGDNEIKATTFFKSKKYILPSIVEDQSLSFLFPHLTIPHEVWIDENGKVIGTSSDEEVTAENIANYLKTRKLNVIDKVDDLHPDYDNLSQNEQEGAFYSSLISDATKTSGSMSLIRDSLEKKNVISLTAKCMSAFHLYSYVLAMFRDSGNPNLNPTRFIIENTDSTYIPLNAWQDFNKPRNNMTSWMGNKMGYNYKIKIPSPGVSDSIFFRKYVLEDLNRSLGFIGIVKKMKISSWIIIKSKKEIPFLADKRDTTAGKIVYNNEVSEEYIEQVKNMSFTKFIDYISASKPPFREYYVIPPLFNETGFLDDKINLNKLHLKYRKDNAFSKAMDLEEWRIAFNRNGLDIKLEDREVEVIVLTKKETPSK